MLCVMCDPRVSSRCQNNDEEDNNGNNNKVVLVSAYQGKDSLQRAINESSDTWQTNVIKLKQETCDFIVIQ